MSAASAECKPPMLPIVATAPATANDRRDKWVDLLSFGIVVLPVLSMVVPRITRARTFLKHRAADDLTGQERAKASHRQRFLRRVVADSERVARGVLHEIVAYHEAQLVAHDRHRKILFRAAHRSALERDHLESCLGQFLRQDAAGPA